MNAPVGFWKSKNGGMRSIASLDPGHLTNCIALVGRMIRHAEDDIHWLTPRDGLDSGTQECLAVEALKLAELRAKQEELVAEKCLRIDHECDECDGTGKMMTWLDGADRYTSNWPCTFCDGKGYYIPSELREAKEFPPTAPGVTYTWKIKDVPSIATVEEYEAIYGQGSCPPICREMLRQAKIPRAAIKVAYRDPELYNAAKDWYFKTQVKT